MEVFTTQFIYTFFLVITRFSGMMLTAPLFSSTQIPTNAKIIITVGLSIVMVQTVYANTAPIPADMLIFTLMVLKELVVGLAIGFVADMIITSVQMGGEYVSHLMGLSIANVVDPVTRQNVPVIGQFYLILALLLFLFIDGHHWLIAAVQTSYDAVPIGFNFPQLPEILTKLVLLSSQMFVLALTLILPLLAILSVTEIALAFMAKVMPQMNIFVVGLPLKILIGLICMLIFMPMSKEFIMFSLTQMCFYLYKLVA